MRHILCSTQRLQANSAAQLLSLQCQRRQQKILKSKVRVFSVSDFVNHRCVNQG